jgi:nicotinate-nucleotide adenylyltransferase
MPAPAPVQHIGLFGGSFDPVHLGHLLAAQSVQQQLRLDEVVFLPAAQSPFKPSPQVSNHHRLTMLAAALTGYSGFKLDDRELGRPGPSYTVYTLREMVAAQPKDHRYLIIGMDAWGDFEHWHAWQEIMQLCHLVVVTRPGYPAPELSDDWKCKQYTSVEGLRDAKAGGLMVLQVPASTAASREIRAQLKQRLPVDEDMPAPVTAYIREHQLYR